MSFPSPSGGLPFDLQAAIDAAPLQSPIIGTDHLPVTNAGTLYHTDPQSILNIGTITTAVGSGASRGVDIRLTGGDGGAGANYSYGARIFVSGGNAGSATVNGYAGQIYLNGGNGLFGALVPSHGSPVSVTGGNSYGGAVGASVFINTGASDTGAAGDFVILTNAATPNGTLSINSDPSLMTASKSWFATELLDGRTIYTATRPEKVTAVIGRVDAANGGAATLVVVKCASGTVPGSGIALTSTSMDLAGTPNANQTLTLSATASDLLLAAGDSLVMVETGVLGTSVGCITVHTTPQ